MQFTTIYVIITNLYNPEWNPLTTGQKASDLKVRSCGKCYHQRYEIRIRFVSLKQRSKIGTGKIAHADYAELLFRIWAFYDKTILDFCFCTIYFWWHVNILSTFLLSIICILKDYFVF